MAEKANRIPLSLCVFLWRPTTAWVNVRERGRGSGFVVLPVLGVVVVLEVLVITILDAGL